MLYHSLGIKMQINISSSFLLKLHEKSEIINLIGELCIPVLALKCHWRFLPDFFCWSFMKNQEQIKKRRPHCDTQLKTLKISYSFFTEGSWKVFFQFLLKLHQKSRNKSIWEEYVVSQSWHQNATNDFLFQCFFTEASWKVKRQKRHEDAKSMMSKFLIAFKKFSAFYFVTGIYEIWRHEDTKIWCQNFLLLSLWLEIRPFILWQEFLKFADMKTQKIWFKFSFS